MSSRHSLVVKPYRPWRYRLAIAVILLLGIAAVAYSYFRGLEDGGYFHGEATAEREALENALSDARDENRELRERVSVLERAREIEENSQRELQEEIVELQDELLQLREELTFYRGIVSPEDGQSGLRIQNFSISPGAEAAVYHYRMMLVQALRHDDSVQGEITMEVVGVQDGEEVRLSLDEVAAGSTQLEFGFRYFQDFEGSLRLPEAFSPRKVAVTVEPSGAGRDPLEETFEWPDTEG